MRDVHGLTDRLGQVLALARADGADVLDIGGDFTNFGDRAVLRSVLSSLPRGRDVVVVHGNHDHADMVGLLPAHLHGAARRIGGLWFVGLGGSNPIGLFPSESTEGGLGEALRDGLASVPDGAPLVVSSHVPPHEVCDYVPFVRRHVGSTALRLFIAERRPVLVTCGHIHESFGWSSIEGGEVGPSGPGEGPAILIGRDADTVVLNAGSLRERRYGVAVVERGRGGVRVTPSVRTLPRW